MSAEFVDPYVYPGTTVLRNKLNLRDGTELQLAERDYGLTRAADLVAMPAAHSFDLNHLRAIHRALFQDIYEWAGELRTVNISKNGDGFHHAVQMDTAAEYTFSWLAESDLATAAELTDSAFVAASAEFLARVNYMHPFREGNGRTQRTFLNDVASFNGRALDWTDVAREENTRASVESHAQGNGQAFVNMLARIVSPRSEGRRRRRSFMPAARPQLQTRSAPIPSGHCGKRTVQGRRCRRRGRCPFHG